MRKKAVVRIVANSELVRFHTVYKNIKVIYFNSLFIYLLSSTSSGQNQSQHKYKQKQYDITGQNETKTKNKEKWIGEGLLHSNMGW
jgi:hypothetical protein